MTAAKSNIRDIKKSFNQFEPSFVTDGLITLADFLLILIS